MKIWLVEIFVQHPDNEYGYASCWYRENKPFTSEKEAKSYLKKFRKELDKDILNDHPKYGIYGWYEDESTIKEIEL